MSRNQTWANWFVNEPEGKYFVEIDPNYLTDQFNCYGLKEAIQAKFQTEFHQSNLYKNALLMIQGDYIEPKQRPSEMTAEVEEIAKLLYGLIHARYLLTQKAWKRMYQKYKENVFDICPRVACKKCSCLPCGEFDELDKGTLCMYCPCCHDLYKPDQNSLANQIDGAFFGTSWIHLFLGEYPDIVKPYEQPVLRVFGLRIVPEDSDFPDSEEDDQE